MKTQSLNQILLDGLNQELVKRISVSKLVLSAVMLVVGLVLISVVFRLSDTSSTLSMILMVGGSVLILLSLFRFFWKSKKVVYAPTGSTAYETSLFFNLKDLALLSELVEDKQFSSVQSVKCESNGNIRLDVLLTQDCQFAALQLFQFIPYTYSPVTSVVYFKGDDAVSVSKFIGHCRS